MRCPCGYSQEEGRRRPPRGIPLGQGKVSYGHLRVYTPLRVRQGCWAFRATKKKKQASTQSVKKHLFELIWGMTLNSFSPAFALKSGLAYLWFKTSQGGIQQDALEVSS